MFSSSQCYMLKDGYGPFALRLKILKIFFLLQLHSPSIKTINLWCNSGTVRGSKNKKLTIISQVILIISNTKHNTSIILWINLGVSKQDELHHCVIWHTGIKAKHITSLVVWQSVPMKMNRSKVYGYCTKPKVICWRETYNLISMHSFISRYSPVETTKLNQHFKETTDFSFHIKTVYLPVYDMLN